MPKQFKQRSINTVSWERTPQVEGTVLELGSAEFNGKARRYMDVATEDQLVRVFHTAGLDDAFKAADKGDHVRFTFLEMRQLKSGNSFRVFESAVWTE